MATYGELRYWSFHLTATEGECSVNNSDEMGRPGGGFSATKNFFTQHVLPVV